VLSSTTRIHLKAAPVYRGKPTAPWLSVCPNVLESLQKVVGTASYKAQAGATTCGADGVFLVRALRKVGPGATLIENLGAPGRRARAVAQREGRIADKYLFPVCRGKDVGRWRADPGLLVLMLQDPDIRVGVAETVLKRDTTTWNFIHSFRSELARRRSSMLPRNPFYSIYGVDQNTFAPFKVVWGRVGVSVQAAVVGSVPSEIGQKVALPFEAMMIPFDEEDEAHYVCGCINSAPAQLVVVGSIVLHPDTHVMRRVAVPKFDPSSATHVEIAALSRRAHELVRQDEHLSLAQIESDLAETCARMWGIPQREVAPIRQCLEQIL
jgi:hypothetical protein